MSHTRIERWVFALSVTLATACGSVSPMASSQASKRSPHIDPAPPSPPTSPSAASTSKLPAAAAAHAPVERPLPPSVTQPLSGEASGAALAEARLVPSGCDDLKAAARRLAEERVREMQRALDEEYRGWAAEQPECWRTFRDTAEEWTLVGRLAAGVGGIASGQGYGAGQGRLG